MKIHEVMVKGYSLLLSLCILSLTTSSFARQDRFVAIDANQFAFEEITFFRPSYENLLTDFPDDKSSIDKIEKSFSLHAKLFEDEYNFSFASSLNKKVMDTDGNVFFPILYLKNFPENNNRPQMDLVSGPFLSESGKYRGFLNAFAFNDQYLSNAASYDFSFRQPDFAIARAVSHAASASTCVDIALNGGLQSASKTGAAVQVSLANARAFDIFQKSGMKDSPLTKITSIAAEIAEFSKKNKAKANQFALELLGRDSVESELFAAKPEAGFDSPLQFFSTIELYLFSTFLPKAAYGQNFDQNILKFFDDEKICKLKEPSAIPTLLDEAVEKFENYIEFDTNISIFRHRDLLAGARNLRIHLPHLLALNNEQPVTYYDDTSLDSKEWEKIHFPSNDGCLSINIDEFPSGAEIQTSIPVFATSCLKLNFSKEGIRPLLLDIEVLNEATSTIDSLKSLAIFQDSKFKTGLISTESNAEKNGRVTVSTTTQNQNADLFDLPIDQSYFYIHNIAPVFANTRDLDLKINISIPKVSATISALDYKKGDSHKSPPIQVVAPTLPDPLYISAALDIQSPKEYENPKMKISFMYAPEMDGLIEAVQALSSDALANISSVTL